MANSKEVKTLIRKEDGSWVDGKFVLFNKNNISNCMEEKGKTLVICSSGRSYFIDQTLDQIKIFLDL